MIRGAPATIPWAELDALIGLQRFPAASRQIDLEPHVDELVALEGHMAVMPLLWLGCRLFQWEGLRPEKLEQLWDRLAQVMDEDDTRMLDSIARAPATPKGVIERMIWSTPLVWNGSGFSVMNNKPPVGSGRMQGIAVLAPDNVWVVGELSTTSHIYQWNGTSWVNRKNNLAAGTTISGGCWSVVAAAPNQVWIGCGNSVYFWDGSEITKQATFSGTNVVIKDLEIIDGEVWGSDT